MRRLACAGMLCRQKRVTESHSLGEAPFGCEETAGTDSFFVRIRRPKEVLSSERNLATESHSLGEAPSGCEESRPIARSASLSESDVRRTPHLASGFQPLGLLGLLNHSAYSTTRPTQPLGPLVLTRTHSSCFFCISRVSTPSSVQTCRMHSGRHREAHC